MRRCHTPGGRYTNYAVSSYIATPSAHLAESVLHEPLSPHPERQVGQGGRPRSCRPQHRLPPLPVHPDPAHVEQSQRPRGRSQRERVAQQAKPLRMVLRGGGEV